jgi:hypothetical protein
MVPRVHHVKKARKDNPAVKKGESYYWWKFRFGGKRYSKTRPKRSQLTQSGFLSQLWDLEDNLPTEGISAEDAESFAEELESLAAECEDSLYAMPDHLQDSSSSGELLQERIDYLSDWSLDIRDLDEEMSDEDRLQYIHDSNPGVS